MTAHLGNTSMKEDVRTVYRDVPKSPALTKWLKTDECKSDRRGGSPGK